MTLYLPADTRTWRQITNNKIKEVVNSIEQQRQHWEARKIYLPNPYISLSISLLWLPCMFLFSLKFHWLQRLLLNKTMDFSSWNVGHVLQTVWKRSGWSLIWEQEGTNVSFISHIHVGFLSSVISLIVLPSLSSAILLKGAISATPLFMFTSGNVNDKLNCSK